MRIDIVTIFPDYFGPVDADGQVGPSGPLGVSLIGKAGARGDIDFRVHDLRRWTTDLVSAMRRKHGLGDALSPGAHRSITEQTYGPVIAAITQSVVSTSTTKTVAFNKPLMRS